jgi:AcrR family transcriptional regulator
LAQNLGDPKEAPKDEKYGLENKDLRVRRTRKLIQQALMELTVEKGFSTITVQDIADRAMANRSTFYRHYLDKYDLLDKYMDEVYELSDHEWSAGEKSDQRETMTGPIALLRHIEKHADFYRVMLGPKGDPLFIQRLRQNTERRFRHLYSLHPIEIKPDDPPLDLRISYIAYASVGAIVWWLENSERITVEQLTSWVGQLVGPLSGLPKPPIRFAESES